MSGENGDRYVIRPATSAPDLWDVWDTMRGQPVFGAEALPKDRAEALARRLSRIYRELHPGC